MGVSLLRVGDDSVGQLGEIVGGELAEQVAQFELPLAAVRHDGKLERRAVEQDKLERRRRLHGLHAHRELRVSVRVNLHDAEVSCRSLMTSRQADVTRQQTAIQALHAFGLSHA